MKGEKGKSGRGQPPGYSFVRGGGEASWPQKRQARAGRVSGEESGKSVQFLARQAKHKLQLEGFPLDQLVYKGPYVTTAPFMAKVTDMDTPILRDDCFGRWTKQKHK